MEYTTQNLEHAVSVFYNVEHKDRAQAHQWLTTAQRCPEAWSFVWELLQPTKATEIQFFAATTLHTKLLRCWHEVPTESHEELKNKILQAVLNYSQGPKIVLNRLFISLAAFILQQGTIDLAGILKPLSSVENTSLLLEVLTVIPEEYNSMTMGTALRIKNRIALQQASPAVLDDMLRYLLTGIGDNPPSEAQIQGWCQAAQCASSWLTLGGDELNLREGGTSTDLADQLPLCNALLNVVHTLYRHNEVISDSALEACEAALTAVRSAGASPDASRSPAAALTLLTALAQLAQPILAVDNRPNSINEELLAAIATCAVALGETHSKCLVTAVEENMHEGAIQFIELVLATQAAPGYYPVNESRSQLVFGLWYTLQDEILCSAENTNTVNEVWIGLFTRLLNVLVDKSEAPPDDAMSSDDAELFRCYRQDIADAVMYCYGVLRDRCWDVVLHQYPARREASLHALLALGDTAPQRQAPAAMMLLLENAVRAVADESSSKRLLHTALEALGAYSWWLNALSSEDCEDGGEAGRRVAAAALRATGEALPRAPAAAALALRRLAAECGSLAAPLAIDIATAAKGQVAIRDSWVHRQLLGAAGAALVAADRDTAMAVLGELASSIYCELVEQGTESSKCGSGAEAAAALLSATGNRPELAAQLLRALLPALQPYAQYPNLVPSLFVVLKQSVTALMDECLPLLEELARLTVTGLQVQPCPSGLDVAKLIVVLFESQWPGCVGLLREALIISARSCVEDASGRADLTEELFSTLVAVTKKKPHIIDKIDDIVPQLIDLACECVRLWESGAARAAASWLAAMAAIRASALRPAAPKLTESLLRCIGGATPRNQMEPVAELLLALNRAPWGEGAAEGLAGWLRASLAPPNFPTPAATPAHKQHFVASVLKEKSSKRRLLETVQEFSLVCRGLMGTEYARQTLASKQLVA